MILAQPPVLPLAVDSSAQSTRTEQALPFDTRSAADLISERKTISPKRAVSQMAGHPRPKSPNPANRGAQLKNSPTAARLQIKASSRGKQESWTVATTTKPATKGSKQTSFRVRVSDVGFRVCLVYYDDLGKRREPYLCYLSAKEWQQAKRGSLASFARLVTDKLTRRSAKPNSDKTRFNELANRINAVSPKKGES